MSTIGKRTKDITGQRFGSLTAIEFSHVNDKRLAFWKYQCQCGKQHVARSNTVSHAVKQKNDPELPSCGCIELSRKTKHGYRKAKDTHPAYKIYRGIMDRCYNTKSPGYQWYGDIGVTICAEWFNNPAAFVEWAMQNGYKPGLHVDKDILCKAKGIWPHIYSPDTCQWVTPKVNVGFATNRDNFGKHPNIRLSHAQVDEIVARYSNEEEILQTELAQQYGVSPSSIKRLIDIANKGAA